MSIRASTLSSLSLLAPSPFSKSLASASERSLSSTVSAATAAVLLSVFSSVLISVLISVVTSDKTPSSLADNSSANEDGAGNKATESALGDLSDCLFAAITALI